MRRVNLEGDYWIAVECTLEGRPMITKLWASCLEASLIEHPPELGSLVDVVLSDDGIRAGVHVPW